jgi:hypothetical protein
MLSFIDQRSKKTNLFCRFFLNLVPIIAHSRETAKYIFEVG